MMVAFADWLKSAKVTDDPEGDLVYDLRRDPDRPPTFTSLRALRRYVGFKSRYDPRHRGPLTATIERIAAEFSWASFGDRSWRPYSRHQLLCEGRRRSFAGRPTCGRRIKAPQCPIHALRKACEPTRGRSR
jgi:hypothetical protein